MEESRTNRDRMNPDRRNEVVRVAARLFAQNGFHGTSMDDIARELGILKGSLYYWIDSKESLLTEVLAGATQQTIDEAEEIIARDDLPATEQLRLLIRSHIESWIRNPDNFNVFLSEHRWLDGSAAVQYQEERSRLEAAYKQVWRKGIAEGTFVAQERDISIQVNLLFGAMNWFPRWYQERGWAPPEYIADTLAAMVINGLAHGASVRAD